MCNVINKCIHIDTHTHTASIPHMTTVPVAPLILVLIVAILINSYYIVVQ